MDARVRADAGTRALPARVAHARVAGLHADLTMSSPLRALPVLALLGGLACPAPGIAADATDVRAPTVTVRGSSTDEPDTQKVAPATTVTRRDLDRSQAGNVFEAVAGTPGVSVNGGPRASGMKFNIRGYSDSEDVLIRLDGAVKNFEKYRFGGTFIEPELLKSIVVVRGPDILFGGGALGGSVTAVTRDAADFLRPGERAGLRLKYGTGSVNSEIQRTAIGFARPTERIDLLVAASRKQSGDYQLADGSRLSSSGSNQRSLMFKGSVLIGDALTVTLSAVDLFDRGRQPYDATAGQPGLFGVVTRTVEDSSQTLNVRWQPDSLWIDFSANLGRSVSHVNDLSLPGQTVFATAFSGNVNDDYDYDVTSADVRNRARFAWGPVGHELTLAAQSVRNIRDVRRVTANATLNAAAYPDGFNASQPPGERESVGAVLQDIVTLGHWSLAPAIRHDRYRVDAGGLARQRLLAFGEPSTVRESETTRQLTLAWRPGGRDWLLGTRYVEGFRPPLVDEYFTQGGFGRCIPALIGSAAPASRMCGALYVPERSKTTEATLAWTPAAAETWTAAAKLTLFRSVRRHILSSLLQVAPGLAGQPGWDERKGIEAEARVETRHLFGQLSYTRTGGRLYDGTQMLDLFDVPGDTIALTLGTRFLGDRWDAGVRVRDVNSRSVVVGLAPGNRPIVGTQAGYELLDLFLGFRPSTRAEYRVTLENAANEGYFLNDGFGGAQGSPAPGRSLRFSVWVQL